MKNTNTARVLLYDIETVPNLAYVWGKWEQNVIRFESEWHMLCFAYKWLGEKKTHVVALPDFAGRTRRMTTTSSRSCGSCSTRLTWLSPITVTASTKG